MLGISEITIDFLTGHPFITGLFFVLFLLFAIYLYRRTNPPLSRFVRLLLTSLRIIAITALFLALFEPVLSYQREYERKPKLKLLVDRSKSMDIIEDGLSRSERVDSVLSSERFKKFSENFDLSTMTFAGNLSDKNKELDREQTALGDILLDLAGREMAAPSEDWLLFSDGISNSGSSPNEFRSKAGTPIYTVGVGQVSSEKDIALETIEFNQTVFAGKPTEITVHLRWQGMNNEKAIIKILDGRREMVSKTISLARGMLKDEIPLKITPPQPGQQTFQVTIEPLADEVSKDNNQRMISMTVMKSRMKVMLVADRIDLEYSFLKRFLSRSESVELTPVVYRGDGSYLIGSFPGSQAELNRYDLIILYDIDIGKLKSKDGLINSFLQDKGGGLYVMPGENYLKASSPNWLDKYLPMISSRKQGNLVYIKFNGRPVENYLFHPAVRISDNRQAVREAWSNLPNFEALVPVDSTAPNSELLVWAEMRGGQSAYPVLAYRRLGAGRVLASYALPFWHWAFFGYGFGGDDSEYGLFISGIVNWLSLKEETDPIRINPDKTIYTRGEKVGFNASVFDLGFRPINGAGGYIILVNGATNDTAIVNLREKGEGLYRGESELLPPGRYQYHGVIEKEGKRLKENSGQLAVESFSIEEYQRIPDFEKLTDLSGSNNGQFVMLNEIDNLYSAIDSGRISVSLHKEIILWNKFWLLALFILMLSLEWFLRKRFQLI